MRVTASGQLANKTYPHLPADRILLETTHKGWSIVYVWHPGIPSFFNPCPPAMAAWYAHHPTMRRKDGGPEEYGEAVDYPFASPQGPPVEAVVQRLVDMARKCIDAGPQGAEHETTDQAEPAEV